MESIPKLLELLAPNSDPIELIRFLPPNLPSRELINSFLSRAMEHSRNEEAQLGLRKNLSARIAMEKQAELFDYRSRTSFQISEDSECHLCGGSLSDGKRETVIREPSSGLLAHQRCHQRGDGEGLKL